MLSGEHVQTIMQTLVGALSPSLVYLFGSESKGTARPDSDIDIAYVSETKLDAYERFLLAQRLASLMNRDVDLIDLDEASTVMQMEIVSQGIPIYCEDPSLRQARVSRVYKMYARLNEERRDILHRILQGSCSMGMDVIMNKCAIMERCVQRVSDEYAGNPASLINITKGAVARADQQAGAMHGAPTMVHAFPSRP